MGFLIKTAFWLSLVLLLIPMDVSHDNPDVDTVGPFRAFLAAREAVSDIAGICERRPDVCETGRSAFQTIGLKARESARMAIAYLDEDKPQADETIVTGSVSRD